MSSGAADRCHAGRRIHVGQDQVWCASEVRSYFPNELMIGLENQPTRSLMSVMGMLRQQSITEMFSPALQIVFTLTRTGIERKILAVLGAKKEIPRAR